MVKKITDPAIKEYHEAVRAYEEKPSPKNRRRLSEAKKAKEQVKTDSLLRTKQEIDEKLAQQREEQAAVEASRAQAKTRLERVRDLIRRMDSEYKRARKLNQDLRAAVDRTVEQKRAYRESLKELRSLKKKLLKQRDS